VLTLDLTDPARCAAVLDKARVRAVDVGVNDDSDISAEMAAFALVNALIAQLADAFANLADVVSDDSRRDQAEADAAEGRERSAYLASVL
jgi:hypothetical protein